MFPVRYTGTYGARADTAERTNRSVMVFRGSHAPAAVVYGAGTRRVSRNMAWTAQSSWEPGVTDSHQPIPPLPHTTAVSERDGRGARPHPASQRPCHSGRTTGITQGRRSLYGGAEQKLGTDRKEENLQMLGKEAA